MRIVSVIFASDFRATILAEAWASSGGSQRIGTAGTP